MSASDATSDSNKSVYRGSSDGLPLPSELVIQIFRNFCSHCTSKPHNEQTDYLVDNPAAVELKWNLINLSLTCHRFRSLAQPILFHYLPRTRHRYEMDFYNPSFYGSVKHEDLFELVRTLVWKKKLRRHLRVIAIDDTHRTMNRWLKFISQEDRERFNKVATKLRMPHCLWDPRNTTDLDWLTLPLSARATKHHTLYATQLAIRMAHNLEALELARIMSPDHLMDIARSLKPMLRLTRLRIGWSLHPYSIDSQAFTDPWERVMAFDCLSRLRCLDLYQPHIDSDDLVQILEAVPNLDTFVWYSKLPWKDLDVNVGGRVIWNIPMVRDKDVLTPPEMVDALVAADPRSLRTLMISMPNLDPVALGFSTNLRELTQLEYLVIGRGVISERDDTPPLVSLLPPSLKRFDVTHLLLLWNIPKLLRMLIQLVVHLQEPSDDDPRQRKYLPNLKVIRCQIRFVKAEASPTDDVHWAHYLRLKRNFATLGIDFFEGAEPFVQGIINKMNQLAGDYYKIREN